MDGDRKGENGGNRRVLFHTREQINLKYHLILRTSVVAFTLALRSSNALTIEVWPFSAAMCKAE